MFPTGQFLTMGHSSYFLQLLNLLFLLTLQEVLVFHFVSSLEVTDLLVPLLQTLLVPEVLVSLDAELNNLSFALLAFVLHLGDNSLLMHHGQVFFHFALPVLSGSKTRLPLFNLSVLEIVLIILSFLALQIVIILLFELMLLPLVRTLHPVKIPLLLE